ncbi:nitroreductase [Novosphingobium humi]|uniref:Nitroreductase n=1 Tax=Novosphingobium humi TaxID=2282397 RepID=A0ABY7U1Z3_9SPHN|nr:nitroreductase [Novosphingobium humi]WCT78610.1 nitroreductase [Novosphingobium humi]
MELDQAIYGRRATRAYTHEPIDRSVLEAVIDAAIQAPSAMDSQPWGFCILRNRLMLENISREAKALLMRAPPAGLDAHRFDDMLGNPDFDIFYQAPVLILICATKDSAWSHIDCTLAAQNLMLAAHGKGLGSCWIGFAQSWFQTGKGRAALDLPPHWQPVAPIIVGHPSADTPAPPREKPELLWRD